MPNAIARSALFAGKFALLYACATPVLLSACHDTTPAAPEPVTSTTPAPILPAASVSAASSSSANRPDPNFVPERVTAEDRAMGTHLAYAAYTTPTVDVAGVRRAIAKSVEEIRRIEGLMTTWRPDTEVSRINGAAGSSPVTVSQETYDVIKESVHTSEISEGTFDITFESLHGLWKFDQDLDPHPPTAAQIKERLPFVGYKHLQLDDGARSVKIDRAGTKISLGGIAKGYAVDRAAKVLGDAGLTSFYVQAGGDLFARGQKPDGSDWSAGIRDPRGAENQYFALIMLRDHAFSTAGDYERSYIVDGKRYHHIIDPRTGSPATASRSVTIWAPTAFQADAIDDAVFILGPEKGLALVESIDGVGAVIVDAKNNVWISKRLTDALRITAAPTNAL